MENKHYYKRINGRKLNRFQEHSIVSYSWGVSFILSIAMLIFSYDIVTRQIESFIASLAFVFLGTGIIQFLISLRVKNEILKFNEIKGSTRKLGYLLLIMGATGNIFSIIAGFTLIRKDRTIEYTISIYSIMTTIAIMVISSLNIFKEYVANNFFIGIIILGLLSLYYIFMMYMVTKHINGKRVDKKLIPLTVPLLGSILIGNFFAFVLGLIIISKYRHKDDEISIEWISVLRRLFRNYMSVIGMFFVVLLISLSICSNMTFDYSLAIDNNYSSLLQTPSLEYPFGTDNYGRCVFTRIVFGARISLVVGIIATMVPIVIGGILGALAGYYGKRTDNTIMRILDILYAVPGILLAIAIIAAFGASTMNLILALSIGAVPMYARTVRATVMSIANQEFVEAARACGARNFTIIFKHIIPNSLAPVIVRATLGIGGVVLSTSSLSYLGLGVEPHIPEWGNILKIGSGYLETKPYLAIFPGLAIILIVLAFNYFGDGLRDALDPKLK
ncbi:ABC transporter permease [Alkaliphilus peptidifermentans]|uniref:Peptide/nickel transport system permease protein n=1 Tax=Alkaliphilus peptidifermentans DSM 18978 TaxID=1120976 RepID=A0A1G5CXE3_9FIRM|nr:ABC transporter permease [Alkaliphilus peptidifermentans]SCY06957.1 peptide/nickel transport system permease protein [Alkaliphilus peptidifermentans DSM 18978]